MPCGHVGHKAPSAKRCIKTARATFSVSRPTIVIKHRAPNGALRPWRTVTARYTESMGHKAPSAKRCIKTIEHVSVRLQPLQVIKHRAPNGALRLFSGRRELLSVAGHKAPSAKRCIKTGERFGFGTAGDDLVIKHRAPNGALRQQLRDSHALIVRQS